MCCSLSFRALGLLNASVDSDFDWDEAAGENALCNAESENVLKILRPNVVNACMNSCRYWSASVCYCLLWFWSGVSCCILQWYVLGYGGLLLWFCWCFLGVDRVLCFWFVVICIVFDVQAVLRMCCDVCCALCWDVLVWRVGGWSGKTSVLLADSCCCFVVFSRGFELRVQLSSDRENRGLRRTFHV